MKNDLSDINFEAQIIAQFRCMEHATILRFYIVFKMPNKTNAERDMCKTKELSASTLIC